MTFHDFEERIRKLCEQVTASSSDTEAVDLARQLQSLMHERVEELRRNLPVGTSTSNDAT